MKIGQKKFLLDFKTGVMIADFQQSGKTEHEIFLLISRIRSVAILTGEALINLVGIASAPSPYDCPT